MKDKEEQLKQDLATVRHDFREFCYRVSHDLQGSLRNVGGFLSLIEGRCATCFDERSKEYLKFVKDGARRAQTLLEGLTEYSYLLDEEKELLPVDLEEIIKEVLRGFRGEIEEKGAKISLEASPSPALGDRVLLRCAFKHVIQNALLYTKETPHVKITIERRSAQFLISISDNGIGIPKDYYARVFKPFERLSPDDSGIGLGLTMTQRIIESHHGRIWVESEECHGSTFYIVFPLCV